MKKRPNKSNANNNGIVFYPELGVDIVAPLMAIDKAVKIYTLGPVPKDRFDNSDTKSSRSVVDKTMSYIHKLMEYGDNRFEATDTDEIVEFFEDIGEKLKSYNFKKKKMWISQYRTWNEKIVSLYYYYGAKITDEGLPFNEPIDYIVHKDFEFSDHLMDMIKPLIKASTKLIAPERELIRDWGVSEETLDSLTPIETYDINSDEDQMLYELNINDYL